jgi:glycogen synthase
VLYARSLHRKRDPREASIAVVIPAKNRAHYLEAAVLSSVYQTRPPQEVYIVVEPSEDSTKALAERLSEEFKEVQCIINDSNLGVAESRNRGILASKSDYVMFLDSDDVLSPRYLEKVGAILDKNPEVGVAYSNYFEFGDRNKVIKLPAFNARLLLIDCIIMGASMARRSALEQVGGYDAEQVFEDWELWIRIIEKGWTAKGVKKPLYNYRIHKGNRDIESNKKRKEGENLIYRKHRELYERYGVGRTADGTWINPPTR